MAQESFFGGRTAGGIQQEVDALRARAKANVKVRSALEDAARQAAELISHGGFPAATSEIAARKRSEAFKAWSWQRGDTVLRDRNGGWLRPYRGRGNTPKQRMAWAHAVNVWALHLIASDSSYALDRVDYSARAVPGVRQGTRLSAELVDKVLSESLDDATIRIQTLPKYRAGAATEAYAKFQDRFDEGHDGTPLVESTPIDHHNEGRSRWHFCQVDGSPVGEVVGTWTESDATIDDEVDPRRFLRDGDERSRVYALRSLASEGKDLQQRYVSIFLRWKKMCETDARIRAAKIAKAKAVTERSTRALRRELSPKEHDEHRRYLAHVVTGQRLAEALDSSSIGSSESMPKRQRRLTQEEKDRMQEVSDRAHAVYERSLRPQPLPTWPDHFKVVKVGNLAAKANDSRDDVKASSAGASKSEGTSTRPKPRKRAPSALERHFDEVNAHRAQLEADEAELLAHQVEDLDGKSDVDLLEETSSFFDSGIDPDSDLDLDRATQAVPELSQHGSTQAGKRDRNLPRGLIGALAQARLRQEDLQRFTRGMDALETAAAS